MERIGVLIETKEGEVKKTNWGVITAARGEGNAIYAVVLDGNGTAYKASLAEYGVHKIIDISTGQGALPWNPELWAGAILSAVKDFGITMLFGLTSAQGRDLLPRIAAGLDAPLVLDCTGVHVTERTVIKSQFSGKAVATVRLHGTHAVIGVRPNSIAAVPQPSAAEILPYRAPIWAARTAVTEVRRGYDEKIDLTEAEIIVSGGRAIEGAENFKILDDCAKVVGAAVGASRAAVDAGYAPHDMQVGQTGKTVNPKLYIACGISGSIQHFAGMKTSGTIVAINTDPDAPIFNKCDYGIVGDLFEIVPLLTDELKRAMHQ